MKFYPYNPDGAPPIFAAITQKQVIVCRVVHSKESPVEIIRVIADEEVCKAYPLIICTPLLTTELAENILGGMLLGERPPD